MRLMSFARTVAQIEERTKTVTRRDGWQTLQPGTFLQAIDRSPRAGKGFRRLAVLRVLDVERQRLGQITAEDVAREGFPGQSPEWFIRFYARGATADTPVTRIEFRYVYWGAHRVNVSTDPSGEPYLYRIDQPSHRIRVPDPRRS